MYQKSTKLQIYDKYMKSLGISAYAHSGLQRKETCACLLKPCSAMDLSMEFFLKPVQVPHLFA